MQVNFKSRKLQKVCNNEQRCIKKFGAICAKRIRARLDELHDSPNLETMRYFPQARFHPLSGDMKGLYAVDVEHPKRLIIKPDHNPIPKKTDGGIDLEQVTRVLVVDIIDYH